MCSGLWLCGDSQDGKRLLHHSRQGCLAVSLHQGMYSKVIYIGMLGHFLIFLHPITTMIFAW